MGSARAPPGATGRFSSRSCVYCIFFHERYPTASSHAGQLPAPRVDFTTVFAYTGVYTKRFVLRTIPFSASAQGWGSWYLPQSVARSIRARGAPVNLPSAIESRIAFLPSTRATPSGARLPFASLGDGGLRGARLCGADLRGTWLGGRGKSLRDADLMGTRYDAETRWPVGSNRRVRGARRVTEPPEKGRR
jgi:hypothetical protein